MSQQGNRKPFTAEIQRRRAKGQDAPATVDNAALMRAIQEIAGQVQGLERRIDSMPGGGGGGGGGNEAAAHDGPTEASNARLHAEAEALRKRKEEERGEIRLLKIELNALAHSIETTKKEIALLMAQSDDGDRLTTVANELDAVVSATETATDTILDNVERIANTASQIQAQEQDSYIRRLADEIQEMTVTIFEACNFQDLTGQRITKVVNTMKFVEQRVDRMMEIWGRDTFNDLPYEPEEEIKRPEEDKRLLNGPQDVEKGISQDEIDRLFD